MTSAVKALTVDIILAPARPKGIRGEPRGNAIRRLRRQIEVCWYIAHTLLGPQWVGPYVSPSSVKPSRRFPPICWVGFCVFWLFFFARFSSHFVFRFILRKSWTFEKKSMNGFLKSWFFQSNELLKFQILIFRFLNIFFWICKHLLWIFR